MNVYIYPPTPPQSLTFQSPSPSSPWVTPLPQLALPPLNTLWQTTPLMPQIPGLHFLDALFSQTWGSSERAEALSTRPCPTHRPGTQSASISARQSAVMEKLGLAGPLASLSATVQTGLELPAPQSQAPPQARRANSHIPLSACFALTLRGCVCGSVQGQMAGPSSPSHAEDSGGRGATVPSHSLPSTHLLSTPRARGKSTHTHTRVMKAQISYPALTFGTLGVVSRAIGHFDHGGDHVGLLQGALLVLKSKYQRPSLPLRQRCAAGKKQPGLPSWPCLFV